MTTPTAFGVNVWWHLPETSVDGVRAQTILKKHGFNAQDLSLPTQQAEVSRAAYSFQNRRGKENRRVTEKSVQDGKGVTYGILDREQAGDQVAFAQHTTVRLDKNTGEVQVNGVLSDAYQKALAEFKGKITDEDIRYFLRRVIKMSYGVAKRPSGGIYFVPAQFVQLIENAQAVLAEFNGAARIYVERIQDGKQERENVWESVEADVEARLATATAALGRIERLSSVQGKKQDIEEASELMKVYQQLLGEEAKYEDIAEKIEDAVRQVSEKIALIAPAAPVTAAPASKKSAKTATAKGGTVVEAAVKVLKQVGKPMGYREIMDAAVKQGLYEATCAAPYESFISGLTKALSKGESRVVRVARGVYQAAA